MFSGRVARKVVGGRLALAEMGNWPEVLRKEEIAADEVKQHKTKPSEAEGTEDEEESGVSTLSLWT